MAFLIAFLMTTGPDQEGDLMEDESTGL